MTVVKDVYELPYVADLAKVCLHLVVVTFDKNVTVVECDVKDSLISCSLTQDTITNRVLSGESIADICRGQSVTYVVPTAKIESTEEIEQ